MLPVNMLPVNLLPVNLLPPLALAATKALQLPAPPSLLSSIRAAVAARMKRCRPGWDNAARRPDISPP